MEDVQEISKLIILYFFDQMEVPLKEDIINDIFLEHPTWLPYTEFRSCFEELLKQNLLVNMAPKTLEPRYGITISSREGLTYFYTKIPMSVRDEISATIKKNRLSYKKKQEYVSDYYKNTDGTYTVNLKIDSAACTLMDLKIVVQDRRKAKWIHNNWAEKAPIIYEHIHENLID